MSALSDDIGFCHRSIKLYYNHCSCALLLSCVTKVLAVERFPPWSPNHPKLLPVSLSLIVTVVDHVGVILFYPECVMSLYNLVLQYIIFWQTISGCSNVTATLYIPLDVSA